MDEDTANDFGVVAQAANEVPRRGRPPRASNGLEDMTRIVLEESEEIPPTGLPVGVNGKAWILRAGEEVNVPKSVLNILNDAIISVPQIDPTSRRVLGYRPRMRFPYRVVPKG